MFSLRRDQDTVGHPRWRLRLGFGGVGSARFVRVMPGGETTDRCGPSLHDPLNLGLGS
jgi:hypothetical protein